MSALDDRPSTRMMYASTAAVYQAQPEVSLTEGSIVRPASAYGAAKAATEILVQQFGDGRVAATTILRLSNVIGPGQPEDLAASAFAVQVARAERRGVSGVLHHGRLDDARDFIDVRDVAAAFLEAAALSDAGTAIYNVGTGEAVPLSRVLDVLIGSSTAEIRGEPDEAIVRGGPRSSVVLDARAFRERTGWRPTIALERSLIDTLDHWRTTLT